jgi:acetoacetyl-CoA synthetase
MLGALFCGSQIVLYDGSPFYPSPEKLLKSVLACGVTSFGAGPRYFVELQKAGIDAKPYTQNVDKIPSAGALLTEAMSLWVKDAFGSHICQISTSGGTELCGNFVHGTQTLPVYAGENAVINLGMDVDVFTPDGKSAPTGERGELVCKKPFPNMPAMFWNDLDGKRYHASYFERFPHVVRKTIGRTVAWTTGTPYGVSHGPSRRLNLYSSQGLRHTLTLLPIRLSGLTAISSESTQIPAA